MVIPRRRRDASYSLRRGPPISWVNRLKASHLPGRTGNADASDAIVLLSFQCVSFRASLCFPIWAIRWTVFSRSVYEGVQISSSMGKGICYGLRAFFVSLYSFIQLCPNRRNMLLVAMNVLPQWMSSVTCLRIS